MIFGLRPGDLVRYKRSSSISWDESYAPDSETDIGVVVNVHIVGTLVTVHWSKDNRVSVHDVDNLERA